MSELSEAKKCWKAESIRVGSLTVENGELKARIREFKEENAQLQACHDSELGVCEKHCDVVARLRKALDEYGRHKDDCIIKNPDKMKDRSSPYEWECTCGWADIMDSLANEPL